MINETETIIDKIYLEHKELVDFLEKNQEISLKSQFDIIFKKNLLLSAASYFEDQILNIIQEFVKHKTQNDKYVISLVKKKVIERQYHTYFEWNARNANKFFSLFGEEFKTKLQSTIDNNKELENSVKAFLELGETRNKLVHLNFASYHLEKTPEEIYKMYQKAIFFVSFLDNTLLGTSTHSKI